MRRSLLPAFLLAALISGPLALAAAEDAHAGLRFCNATDASASVAIGYEAEGGTWTSEGWWRLDPGDCKTVVAGDLKRHVYYWRATSKRYSWASRRFMFCTSPTVFTIEGDDACEERGYDRNPFNEIRIKTGVTEFTFTLNPPGGDAPVADAEPAAPQSDPPGTHGEPYTISGFLGGCEGLDTAVACTLYANGFRYQAVSGGPTPLAVIERLMDLPVNTPMTWSGDMISTYGAQAEVTIRQAREEGADPYAAVRKRLQGYWASAEDPLYTLLLAGDLFEESYQDIPTDTRIVEIAAACEGSKGSGPYLIAHPYSGDEDERCFEIVEATSDSLVLFPLGTMGFLEFRKRG